MLRLRTRIIALTVAAAAATLVASRGTLRVSAQAPMPSPPPTGQTAPIPGSATVPPGGTVTFTSPVRSPGPGEPRPPGGAASVRVDNRSDQPATVAYDGLALTIEVSVGFIPEVQRVQARFGTCAPAAGRPNVVICTPVDPRPPKFLAFGTTPASAPTDRTKLVAGCTSAALTLRVGTSLRAVAAAVAPPGALESIFKFDLVRGRFRGFSPVAPAFANDYAAVETTPEVTFICTREPATLARPQP